ncbi:MAG: hypothetical protein A2X86_17125 [Bdellovibrionales bacterium GWA2_49_15]|nr:MAG: hypothetical protein A2X86_17125 [Bdellovibrionales bacterium GWA2_49_15]HAZ14039.1 hypothetical protein [Bdellovibrionales bacterium]
MSQICLILFLLWTGISCSAQKTKPLSDAELADLAKNFNIDNEEFKKFRPAPIAEKFVVEQPGIIAENKDGLAYPTTPGKEEPKAQPTSVPATVKTGKWPPKSPSKAPTPQPTPVPASTPVPEVVEAAGSGGQFDGLDRQSATFWSKFRKDFSSTEIQVIKIKYLGITVGHITLRTMPDMRIGNVDTHHFRGELKSATYYEMLYKLDDVIESFVAKANFLPVKYFLAQRESGKNIDDLQLFDHEKLKTYHWYKKEKKGEISKAEKQGDLPKYFQDSFSALYFMRGLPAEKGLHYEFPVINRGKLYISKIDVIGSDKVNVMGKTYSAVMMRVTNNIPGVDDTKKDDMEIWFSADENRILLKFKTKIKLGSAEGEIVQYDR